MQRVIIAGGRDFDNLMGLGLFLQVLVESGEITLPFTVVSGMARGADALGLTIAKCMKTEPVKMAADWDRYGKSAGYRRNADMAVVGDLLIAAWDGSSRGTQHMIETMQKLNKPVHILSY